VSRAPWFLFAAAAVVFAIGLFQLANRQLAGGAVYPEYSSLRADPEGGKLLFDALGKLPGITVERNFMPLSALPEKHAALLMIGVEPQSLNSESELQTLGELAYAGNRVVLAFHFERSLSELKTPVLAKTWDVITATDRSGPRGHPFFFRESKGWTALRLSGEKILAMERRFGSGSVLLAAESDGFANSAVWSGREMDLISQAIGEYRRVVFDESHLGIAESGSVVALARRFRLMGFAAGLGICAVLFFWKSVSGFPPPAPVRVAARSGITAQAGLATLLRRHIAARDLPAACWRSWLETNRRSVPAERIQRVEQILSEPAEPAAVLRRAGAVLQAKGEL
jgi:hypothetical protein